MLRGNLMENYRTKTLITGAIIGAFAGIAAAYIMMKRSEETQRAPQLTTSEGVKLGLGLLGLFKLIADTTDGKK